MKKILVPIDFSHLSISAAQFAVDIAKEMKSEIVLASVVHLDQGTSRLMNWRKLQAQMLKDADLQGDKFVSELRSYGPGINISYTTIPGAPLDRKVLDFATDNDVDLIVAGTKGASGLKAIVLGSNTASLINHSEVPIVAVPADARYNGFKRIVLATDLMDLDRQVRQVVKFAKVFDSQIDILHVADVRSKQHRRDELQSALIKMTGYEKIRIYILPADDVVAAINGYVVEQNADLLVMFTHELGTLEKLFRKGHTREMAHQIEVPLLSFKRP